MVSRSKKPPGFTLVELLVVVAIISLLSAVAIPQYRKFAWRTQRADAIVALSSINLAEQAYFAFADEFLPGGGCATSNCSVSLKNGTTPVNERLGLGSLFKLGSNFQLTSTGYQMTSYTVQGSTFCGEGASTKSICYAAELRKDLDGDPSEDTQCNLDMVNIGYNPKRSSNIYKGIPYILRDDVSNGYPSGIIPFYCL